MNLRFGNQSKSTNDYFVIVTLIIIFVIYFYFLLLLTKLKKTYKRSFIERGIFSAILAT